MQHRDNITLNKIIKEADIAIQMLKDINEINFIENEMLKRATAMTVINIGELVKNLTMEFRMEYNLTPMSPAT